MTQQHTEQVKHVIDVAAVGTTLSAIIGWLPAIAALISIIWGLIRIYETQTVQKLIERIRSKS